MVVLKKHLKLYSALLALIVLLTSFQNCGSQFGVKDQSSSGSLDQSVNADPNSNVTISVQDAATLEGSPLSFTVSLNQVATVPVDVTLRTIANSAIEGLDYTAFSNTVSIPVGQTQALITIPTTLPTKLGSSREMSLEITNVSIGLIARARGVGAIQKMRAIMAGQGFLCQISATNTVRCSGDNTAGQLGNPALGNRSAVPVEVPGLVNILAMASGEFDTCVINDQRAVFCWGNLTQSTTPRAMTGLANAKEIIVSLGTVCVLTQTNAVHCRPLNPNGLVTIRIPDNGASSLAAGYDHMCAVTPQGTVKCAGSSSNGQLGIEPNQLPAGYNGVTFLDVPNLTGVRQISAGTLYTCALMVTGTVKCWGYNSGVLLNIIPPAGVMPSFTSLPQDIPGLSNIKALAIKGGRAKNCGISASDTVVCWGRVIGGVIQNPMEIQPALKVRQLMLNYDEQECVLTMANSVGCRLNQTYVDAGF